MPVGHAVVAELEGARKRYGGTQALDGLDLALHAGRVTALLGANGAGKSTAVHLLLGLLAADAGTVRVFGRPASSRTARLGTGAMLQSAGLPDRLRVGELLALVRSYYPDPRSTADCVALAGLDGLLERPYRALSGGQQRRVQFALALCGRPRLLCLDEPTTGLDIEARQTLWAAVRELVGEGCGVLLTTHYLEEAEALSDHVVVVDAGRKLVEGSVAAIRGHVAQRRIRCVTALEVDAVAAWPGVRSARREGDALQVVADAPEPVVRRLLDEDATLHDLEVQRAGLADAFLALTRTSQEEAA
ncbi:MAG TPA: ABC transporter ATP-binding protein [Thermomonas sp.]